MRTEAPQQTFQTTVQPPLWQRKDIARSAPRCKAQRYRKNQNEVAQAAKELKDAGHPSPLRSRRYDPQAQHKLQLLQHSWPKAELAAQLVLRSSPHPKGRTPARERKLVEKIQ
jgi:hypothetical protein